MRATVDSCAALALEQLPDGLGPRFAESPLATLREGLGLTVRPVDQLDQVRADGGLCDGTSYLSDGVILYRRTGNRRENFTLAHELGHWLVDQVDDVYDWLAEQPEPMKMLETVCDRIASQLLLPDAAVAQVVGAGPVSARHVGELVDATQASRPACGIALASSLAGLGAVVIIDRLAGRVEYASVQPDPEQGWPTVFPWPGQPVPAGHPLAKLADGATLTRKTFWQTPWGNAGGLLRRRGRPIRAGGRRVLRHRRLGCGAAPSRRTARVRPASRAVGPLLRSDPHRAGLPLLDLQGAVLPVVSAVSLRPTCPVRGHLLEVLPRLPGSSRRRRPVRGVPHLKVD